ncbi:unnamed protein product, partial [Didymodactylos carnosus]
MPKKFGDNTKAVEAREKKNAAKQVVESEKQRKLEDEYWKDDDKNVQKKLQRKDEKEKKLLEKTQRKQEIQQMLEQEETTLTSSKPKSNKVDKPIKVTQAQIDNHTREQATSIGPITPKQMTHLEMPLEENINRLKIEGDTARNVDEAIAVL